ncbi:MAG: TonB family protein [Bacteroidetes bacterium]|jgi:TonB family protein|nr:TonB family protein [Bacteroidota bacterium]
MELWMQHISELVQSLLEFTWLPILIWSSVAGIAAALLHRAERLHVQVQYHLRIALVISLPLGLLSAWGVDQLSTMLTAMGAQASSLKVLSVTSPLEVGISASAAIPFPTLLDLSFLFAGTLYIAGLMWFLTDRLRQWFLLQLLAKKLPLTRLSNMNQLSNKNRTVLNSTGKSISIGFTTTDIVPVTFGVFRPVILVPRSLINDASKLNLAIRHELTHIQNHDFATHLLTSAIQSIFWFHPLIHMLANQLVEYREMRCDSMIVSDSSVSRQQYASLLFELLPMSNINRQISVNMAQKSSSLKERIERIAKQPVTGNFPKPAAHTMLATLLLTLTLAMACTDFQTQAVFDEEELDLMTDVDRTGERGYHQIIIILGEEGQTERHEKALSQLNEMTPEYIKEIEILTGDAAEKQFGERAAEGAILVKTNPDVESYNTTLSALGMNADRSIADLAENSASDQEADDFFVVVEEMPELIGGLASIQKNIRYPEMARRAGIEGRVYVQFIVNEQGEVERPKVIRGIGGGADEEALRAVKQAKFKPGIQRGQPVRVQYSLPVVFRLQNGETDGQTSSNDISAPKGSLIVHGYGHFEKPEGSVIEPATLTGHRQLESGKSGIQLKRVIH